MASGGAAAPSSLLDLPEPCLLAVLQRCAADSQHSLFSAARAHSRLHQAAVLALRSIAAVVAQQQQADSAMLYLRKHGQHIDSVELEGDEGCTVILGPLPPNLQLHSLQLGNLQLQPRDSLQDVLGALTQLRLRDCKPRNKAAGKALTAALWQLPAGLQHLSISWWCSIKFPTGVLQRLEQLTYLELDGAEFLAPDEATLPLQPLSALTRLADLRIAEREANQAPVRLTASMLSGAHLLTRLELSYYLGLEPSVLAGKTRLQHLAVQICDINHAAGAAQLLSYLQHLQQLTHLDLTDSLEAVEEGNPPAAAYAALTASSRLQHLNISSCVLPGDAWQHVFPAGRQLPHLRELDIQGVEQPSGDYGEPPEGTRLVSCCPALQSLDMRELQYCEQLLAPLQGLSGLQSLCLDQSEFAEVEGLEGVCQLAGLRELTVVLRSLADDGLLLQLTQLQQLTALTYCGVVDHPDGGRYGKVKMTSQAPGDEPVWRQLLLLHLDHSDPAVAQQAAAALAALAG